MLCIHTGTVAMYQIRLFFYARLFQVFRIWCISALWRGFMREEECEKKIVDMPQIMKSVYVHNVKYFFFLFITLLENTIIQSGLIVFWCLWFGKLTHCLIPCFFLRWLKKWQKAKLRSNQSQTRCVRTSQCVRPSQLGLGVEYRRDYFCVADGWFLSNSS